MEIVKNTNENPVEGNLESTLKSKTFLLNEQKRLVEKTEVLIKEMQEREYEIEFTHKKIFSKVLKFLEKDASWGHTTAAGLIMLYHNMREFRDVVNDKNWDGKISLRAVNVSTLWNMLSNMKGNGFYQAKDFVEIMATIGQPISNAHSQVIEDNTELRNVHSELGKIDDLLDSGKYVEDTND